MEIIVKELCLFNEKNCNLLIPKKDSFNQDDLNLLDRFKD